MPMYRRKGNIEAAQYKEGDATAVQELGGAKVHMGPTAEEGVEHPHLSTDADGNICLCDGDWLVKTLNVFEVLSNDQFVSMYEAA